MQTNDLMQSRGQAYETGGKTKDERIIELESMLRESEQYAAQLEIEEERLDAELAAVEAERDRLRALLLRYRNETPLGHQPHMIASEVDAALEAAREGE